MTPLCDCFIAIDSAVLNFFYLYLLIVIQSNVLKATLATDAVIGTRVRVL
jgi:hypothetical protein